MSDWKLLGKKSIQDTDGFLTDYALYKNTETGEFVAVYGDTDFYRPEDGDFDAEFDTEWEARQWFDSYGEDDDLLEGKKTTVKTYVNKRNHNKQLKVHNDGYGHRAIKQEMHFDNGVVNPTGDGNLHRWKKKNADDLLADYDEISEDLDTSSIDDAEANRKIAYDFVNWVDRQPAGYRCNVDVYTWNDDGVVFDVSGDWKHDHLRCNSLFNTFCDIRHINIVNAYEDVIEESDEDSYESLHGFDIIHDEESLTESLDDEMTIKHVDDVFEGMVDNASDKDIAAFQRIIDRVRKTFKVPESDIAIVISDDIWLDNGTPVGKDGLMFVQGAPLFYEKVNGNTWVYFPNDDEASIWCKGYFGNIDESLNESYGRDIDLAEYAKSTVDFSEAVEQFVKKDWDKAYNLALEHDDTLGTEDIDKYDITDILMENQDKVAEEVYDWYADYFEDELVDEIKDRDEYNRDPYAYNGVSRSDFF